MLGVLPALVRDPLAELDRIAVEHTGQIPLVRVGPLAIHFLTHPDHARHLLQESWRNYSRDNALWKPFKRFVGEGLFFGDADLWQKRRRLMQPLFVTRHLAGLAGVIGAAAARHADRLERSAASGTPVDMVQEMTDLVMAMTLEAQFGVGGDALDGRAVGQAIRDAQRVVNFHMLLSGLPDWLPRPGEASLRRNERIIEDFILGLVRERRAAPAEKRRDLLTLLVRARDEQTGEMFGDRALRDELVTLFSGGFEMTSLALSWLWYELGERPDIEARVRAEILDVLGGRTPTLEDLGRLSYTTRVIQESLRYHTILPAILRVALADDVIDGYRIPAGAVVLLSPHAMHQNPAFWDEPRRFDPDRFTPERSEARTRFAYLSFGAGPRQCIGMQLAMMEMQMVLALLLPRFRARLAPGHPPVRPRLETSVKPHPGLRMTIERI